MNDESREASIRSMLPLVKRIARRIHRLVPSVDVDDLTGDGSIGLIRAVDSFDPTRGPSLEQYARQLIVGSMLNGIRRMDPVPERARRALREGENDRYGIAVTRGEVPTLSEMDKRRPGFANATLTAHRAQALSIDAPLPEGESLSGDWTLDPAQIVEERTEAASLRALMQKLPERERKLMEAHYYGERSLREIGRRMGISAQRASQLHLAALHRLRRTTYVATD